MPKTLYISDLDGTLLSPDARLSETTVSALQKFHAHGIALSPATARSPASVPLLLARVHDAFAFPAVMMNGVLVGSLSPLVYHRVCYLPQAACAELFALLRRYETTGFLYEIEDGVLTTYYESLDAPLMRAFYEERAGKFHKRFLPVSSLEMKAIRGVYLTLMERDRDRLAPIAEALQQPRFACLRFEFYLDIYDAVWYLEIFSANATKANAVHFLRETYGFSHIIGFGDNLNDLSLFDACDECYAVQNARDPVKARATAVLPHTNAQDAVVHFIAQREGILL